MSRFPEPPRRWPDILGQPSWPMRGLTQFRCAETEKFPHVTFFFNDYREDPFPGEQRLLASQSAATWRRTTSSPRCPPSRRLSAGVARSRVERRRTPSALFVVNFANGDMVGHTGVLDAA